MRIGIPRESRPGETLVAATAKTAAQLAALGYDVVVESGAGAAADQPDATYADVPDCAGRDILLGAFACLDVGASHTEGKDLVLVIRTVDTSRWIAH